MAVLELAGFCAVVKMKGQYSRVSNISRTEARKRGAELEECRRTRLRRVHETLLLTTKFEEA